MLRLWRELRDYRQRTGWPGSAEGVHPPGA